MRLGDIDMSVRVADKSLAEYNVDEPTGREASCYIPSQTGQTFTISYKNRSRAQSYRMKLYVDGRLVSTKICDATRCITVEGIRVSDTQMRPFVFAGLHLVDEDTHLASSVNIEALGTIEARVYRTTYVGKRKRPKFTPRKVDDVGSINERSKKAGGHCVTFGDVVPTPRAVMSKKSYRDIDSEDRPYYTLRFRYRSEDLLQAQGIMPVPAKVPGREIISSRKRTAPDAADEFTNPSLAGPSAAHVSKKAKIKAEDPDGSDVEVLQSQLDEMKNNMAEIRKKIGQKRATKSMVKRECSPITLQTQREVIDLTSD